MKLTHGADPEVLERVSRQLTRSAGDLRRVRDRSDAAVRALEGAWGGQDHRALFGSWFGCGSAQLCGVEQVLTAMGRLLLDNARQQRETSGDGPEGGASGGSSTWDGPPGGSDPGDGPEEVRDHEKDPGGTVGRDRQGTLTDRHQAAWWVRQDGRTGALRHEHYEGSHFRRDEYHAGISRTRDGSMDDGQVVTGRPKLRDSVDADADVVKAHGQAEGNLLGTQQAIGKHADYEASVVHAEVTGDAGAGVSKEGLAAHAGVEGGVSLGHAKVQYAHDGLEANATVDAVGATAAAAGSVALGKSGLHANVGGSAFAGGQAKAQVSKTVGPVTAGVGGHVSYGIGVHAQGNVDLGWDKVGASVDIGATLGLGAGVKFDVSVNPQEALEDLGDVAGDVGEGAEDLWHAATPW